VEGAPVGDGGWTSCVVSGFRTRNKGGRSGWGAGQRIAYGASAAPGAGGSGKANVQQNTRPSPLERFLGTFTDIRPGEGPTGLVLFANVFLLLCAYYFVKPLRDSWIAVSSVQGLSTMELKAYSSFGQSLLLAGLASLVANLSHRVTRSNLVSGSILISMSNLVVFWLLRPGFLAPNVPYAGIAFYLWVGMFGVFLIAQFWTMAADLYAGERGTRLLPLIAIGATAGAAFGSWLTTVLVSGGMSPATLLILANIPLAASIVLSRLAYVRGPLGRGRVDPLPRPTADDERTGRAGRGAIGFIFTHRYLVTVALVALLTNWVNTNGENLMFRVLQDTLASKAAAQGITDPARVQELVGRETTLFYSSLFTYVNVIALVAQAFLASRLLRYGGFGAIMLMLPVISLISYSTMALLPILPVVRSLKIAENSTDYSINNTARQVLWLPTSSETKYRAKPAIDSLFLRLGDGLAALTVVVGVHFLDLPPRAFFLVNVVLAVAWLLLAVTIVRAYSRMMSASPEQVPA
jgi:AAA family ATP:ADP antiporter